MNRKIMDAMEYMEESYIGEVLDAGKKASTRRSLMRWGSLAACLVLIVGLCIGIWGGSNPQNTEPQLNAQEKEIVLPPTRYGAGDMAYSLARSFTLEEAYEEADVVAWVRIGNWLGERSGDMTLETTYYEAEIVQCFKGNPGENIVLEQLGSSAYTISRYPLFTNGNELLVFLVGGEDRVYYSTNYTGTPYEYSYYINGSYSTVMDVVSNTDGKVYVVDRIGVLSTDIQEYAIHEDTTDNLRAALCDVLSDVDSVQQEILANAENIFTMETIEDLFAGN